MNETIIKFGDTAKHKFHQHKSPVSIENIDVNKIIVSNKVYFGKKDLKYFIGYKDATKLDLYAYFFQKLVHIEETLMKLNICFFVVKDDELLEK